MDKSIILLSVLLVVQFKLCLSQGGQDAFCNSLNTIRCNAAEQYRPITGRCNNLNNPFWGAASTKFNRLVPPRYADGVSQFPRSVSGGDLPSARLVSLELFGNQSVPDTQLSLTAMTFSHFFTHDMARSGANPPVNGCCGNRVMVPNPDPFCEAIPIPPNDPFFRRDECQNFLRNFVDLEANCPNYRGDGFAQQINRVTSFLDLSTVYDSSENRARDIRAFVDGRMIIETRNGQTWPPRARDTRTCELETPTDACYLSGDGRINQHPQLTIIHVLFLREHNRIADALKALNPTWNDNQLFQEARRINIAQYQYIVYYEFLPHILGLDNMKRERLYYYSSGGDYVNDYDASVDPSIINEFTGAAFRYFHTMIRGIINVRSQQGAVTRADRLTDILDRPALIEDGDNFQGYTRGMNTDPSESRDENVDPEIQHFLNRRGNQVGMDLKARDIQRDRDHGIGRYNDMRVRAGLRRATSFNDLLDVISPTHVANLQRVYSHVNDIDLSVGGDLENPVDNSVRHGRTYHQIFIEQFRNTRVGDRFWFERSTIPHPFTPAQLNEIRKTSFSRIICDNSNYIGLIQPDSFALPNTGSNTMVPCSSLPSVNLSLWRA